MSRAACAISVACAGRPAFDVIFVDELEQFALGKHEVKKFQAREFVLLAEAAARAAPNPRQLFQSPVVQSADGLRIPA